jgi:hypothetical protein
MKRMISKKHLVIIQSFLNSDDCLGWKTVVFVEHNVNCDQV